MSVELRYMPCAEFELAIHGYVDREIASADSKELLIHLELCDSCRDAVELVRRQVRTHRDAVDLAAVVDGFDKSKFFAGLNGTLLRQNLVRLAELFYELGKAYFVAGNDSKLITFLHKKALAIERTRAEGRQVVKETSSLMGKAEGSHRKTKESVRRAEQALRGRRTGRTTRGARIGARGGRSSLDNSRRFLEECLILKPDHASARLYLGVYFVRIDRPEEAIAEYRKILTMGPLPRELKVMTLQAMGNAHAYRLDYSKAVDCFEEIVQEGILDHDSRFFTVLLSLAMFHAKLGRYEQSRDTFGELVTRFPGKLREARNLLEQAEVFRSLLRSQSQFRSELFERYPVLFAG